MKTNWMSAFAVTAAIGISACATMETGVPDAVVKCGVPAGRSAPKGAALVGQEYGLVMSAIPYSASVISRPELSEQ